MLEGAKLEVRSCPRETRRGTAAVRGGASARPAAGWQSGIVRQADGASPEAAEKSGQNAPETGRRGCLNRAHLGRDML